MNDFLSKLKQLKSEDVSNNKPSTSIEYFIEEGLCILSNLKNLHWNTLSEPKHRALGDAYDSWDELLDTIIESFISYEGRKISSLKCNNISLEDIVQEMYNYQQSIKNYADKKGYSDIDNLSDELRAVATKLNYKLTMTEI